MKIHEAVNRIEERLALRDKQAEELAEFIRTRIIGKADTSEENSVEIAIALLKRHYPEALEWTHEIHRKQGMVRCRFEGTDADGDPLIHVEGEGRVGWSPYLTIRMLQEETTGSST